MTFREGTMTGAGRTGFIRRPVCITGLLLLTSSLLCGAASAASAVSAASALTPADKSAAADLYQITVSVSDLFASIGITDIYSIPAILVAAGAGAAAAALICLTAALISRACRRWEPGEQPETEKPRREKTRREKTRREKNRGEKAPKNKKR